MYPIRDGFLASASQIAMFDMWIFAKISVLWPGCPSRPFMCLICLLMPSTNTYCLSLENLRIVPCLPLSFPAITTTKSPTRNFILYIG